MRHIQDKNDWYYEMKPSLLYLLGFLGILNGIRFTGFGLLEGISLFCGVALIGLALKINKWRHEYRRKLMSASHKHR